VARRHSLENTTWLAIRNSSSDTSVGWSASSTTGRPRSRAAAQIGRTNSGKAVVGEHRVGGRHQPRRIGGHDRRQQVVAVRDDHPLAACIDEDRRQRGRYAGDALASPAVDALAPESGEHAVAERILAGRAAERARQRRLPAEPRDGDGGIGGAAAVDDEVVARRRFRVRLRKIFDQEDLVEHDDPGTQDRWRACAAPGASGTRPHPPPRRG
jgi:hypothetical protein